MLKWHEEWLAERDAKIKAHRAKQLDVSNLVGKTIAASRIVSGVLTLTFSDDTSCSFDAEGYYDKVEEDLECEVLRVVEDNLYD